MLTRRPLHEIPTPHTVGLIGDPLDFTLSPVLHNALFARLALPFVYLPFRVRPRYLPALIRTMRLMDVTGLNVTAPHKCRVIPLLDRLDATAARIGAVNTIVMRRHRAIGYNTDAAGFLAALQHRFAVGPRGLTVTLIGAGGTARAIADGLLRQRVRHLTILNRTRSHAIAVQRQLQRHYRRAAVISAPLTVEQLRRAVMQSDLIIQASSASDSGRQALAWPGRCRSRAMLLDVRYGPASIRFLQRATDAGLQVADGLEMLLQQAARSFTLWTGMDADLRFLRRVARRALRSARPGRDQALLGGAGEPSR